MIAIEEKKNRLEDEVKQIYLNKEIYEYNILL